MKYWCFYSRNKDTLELCFVEAKELSYITGYFLNISKSIFDKISVNRKSNSYYTHFILAKDWSYALGNMVKGKNIRKIYFEMDYEK